MTERTSLNAFTPQVLLAVGDCPVEIAEEYVREAAIALCSRAQVIHREIVVSLWAGVREYHIDPPPGEDIVSIQRVAYGCYDGLCTAGFPVSCGAYDITAELPNHLYLLPAPSCDSPDGLRVTVAVRPSQDACDVATPLYDKYHHGIVKGAVARLLSLKAMPWYDRTAARDAMEEAERAIASAGTERIVGIMRNRTPRMRLGSIV